ncbi:MAG: hypothetical protein EPN21_13175 [Methylococcaceae bacterium]|nr:MAG: hypothetical protein EPN21_13175 [Methylococcaceae bacterium]
MQYYTHPNPGVGFITHEDVENNGLLFSGILSTLYAVDGYAEMMAAWALRTGAHNVTLTEAQALVDAAGLMHPDGNRMVLS